MAKRYELNDQQWARIAEMLPARGLILAEPQRTTACSSTAFFGF